MKHDWKKNDKALYGTKEAPLLLSVPPMVYFSVSGQGDPNADAFSKVLEALYTASYVLKMLPKKESAPLGYIEYSVFPLEAVWTVPDEASILDKSQYCYEAQIRQPAFCTTELAARILQIAAKKKPHLPWQAMQFVSHEEGRCVQALHIGSYDDETRTFASMDAFCKGQGLTRRTQSHREIYLNDPRKTAPEKLKTLLRYQIV